MIYGDFRIEWYIISINICSVFVCSQCDFTLYKSSPTSACMLLRNIRTQSASIFFPTFTATCLSLYEARYVDRDVPKPARLCISSWFNWLQLNLLLPIFGQDRITVVLVTGISSKGYPFLYTLNIVLAIHTPDTARNSLTPLLGSENIFVAIPDRNMKYQWQKVTCLEFYIAQ